MTGKYYILRYEHTDALHKKGDQLLNAKETLSIGQTENCQAQLVNPTQYEDAVYAVITPRTDGTGWNLVKVSPYNEHEVRVNGVPMGCVHTLADGDRIAFGGQQQELLFLVRDDDEYQARGIVMGTQRLSRGLIALMAGLPLLLAILLLGYIENTRNKDNLTAEQIAEAKQSVLQIVVDEVQLVEIDTLHGDTTVLKSCPWGVAGSAFLTKDSLLVTARHCIEPWLNIADSVKLDTQSVEPLPVRWALQAETHNQFMEPDDSLVWELISLCTIIRTDSGVPTTIGYVRSIDFVMEKNRDEVIEIGDFEHQYFWRSVSAKPRRVDMMLDDFAYMKASTAGLQQVAGNITLADTTVMRNLNDSKNKALTILGFPEQENTGGVIDAEKSQDELKQQLNFDAKGYPVNVLSHNGEIGHGFSGGPVLWRDGDKYYAVGIVSVTDKKNKNRTYSVPVTEIERKQNSK